MTYPEPIYPAISTCTPIPTHQDEAGLDTPSSRRESAYTQSVDSGCALGSTSYESASNAARADSYIRESEPKQPIAPSRIVSSGMTNGSAEHHSLDAKNLHGHDDGLQETYRVDKGVFHETQQHTRSYSDVCVNNAADISMNPPSLTCHNSLPDDSSSILIGICGSSSIASPSSVSTSGEAHPDPLDMANCAGAFTSKEEELHKSTEEQPNNVLERAGLSPRYLEPNLPASSAVPNSDLLAVCLAGSCSSASMLSHPPLLEGFGLETVETDRGTSSNGCLNPKVTCNSMLSGCANIDSSTEVYQTASPVEETMNTHVVPPLSVHAIAGEDKQNHEDIEYSVECVVLGPSSPVLPSISLLSSDSNGRDGSSIYTYLDCDPPEMQGPPIGGHLDAQTNDHASGDLRTLGDSASAQGHFAAVVLDQSCTQTKTNDNPGRDATFFATINGLAASTSVESIAKGLNMAIAQDIIDTSMNDISSILFTPLGTEVQGNTSALPLSDMQPLDATANSGNALESIVVEEVPQAGDAMLVETTTDLFNPSPIQGKEMDCFSGFTLEQDFSPPSSPFLSSSPFPSSSPPRIFSSSPLHGFDSSPPSCSLPSSWTGNEIHSDPCYDASASPGDASLTNSRNKRSRSVEKRLDDGSSSSGLAVDEKDTMRSPRKRIRTHESLSPYRPPNPKRATLASQQKQRKKLVAPFRSPLVDKTTAHQGIHAVYASGKSIPIIAPQKGKAVNAKSPPSTNPQSSTASAHSGTSGNDYTENAAKQFKSPLLLESSAPSSAPSSQSKLSVSSAQTIPTIRALQAKVQTLKQAIKIKNSGGGEEEQLEELVRKWTNAGREVAWAVWDTVKDLDPGESANPGQGRTGWFDDEHGPHGVKAASNNGWAFNGERSNRKVQPSGFGGSWGWDESGKKDESAEEEQGHGIDSLPDAEEEDAGRLQHSLGTMLRHLGIAPETLGWDEDEGDFVDDV